MTRARRGFGRIRKCQPSGRYQASYVGPDDRLYKAPETFAARVDAEGWLTDRRREIDRELWSPPATNEQKRARRDADVTFGDFAKRWVETRTVTGRPLRQRTREHYEALLEDHVYPTFKRKAVRDITMESVDKWYAKTAKNAPTTRAHAYSLLRAILETARKRDRLIDFNPCEIVGAGSTKRKTTTTIATIAELDVIAKEMPERLAPMILLAAWCGLRMGELVELRRSDIDTDAGIVHVRRGAARVAGGWVIGPTKSDAGERDVVIPPHILPAILARVKACSGNALLFPPEAGEVVNGKPVRLQPSTFYRHFYQARDKAKRSDLRFHDLRHTGATMAAQTGATLAELMSRIGHSTPAAAMRYQHAAQGRDRAIAEAMSQLAGVATPESS